MDFSPVESCIQVGSPKGVGRFNEQDEVVTAWPSQCDLLPPNPAMELIEALALKTAIEHQIIEDRIPYLNSYDVLIQFLMTLAVGDGFQPKMLYLIIQNTFVFKPLIRIHGNGV